MTARKLRLVEKRQREAQKRHDRYAGARVRSQDRLDKAGHYAIKVRTVRATIGEIFNHARQPEALLTHRYREPMIVLVEELEDFLAHRRGLDAMPTELLYAELKVLARRWARKRAPVRHRVWKDEAK